jgi:hypothetical protein
MHHARGGRAPCSQLYAARIRRRANYLLPAVAHCAGCRGPAQPGAFAGLHWLGEDVAHTALGRAPCHVAVRGCENNIPLRPTVVQLQVKNPMTMTEKILARHSDNAAVVPGQNIWTSVDKLLTHDVCGPGTFGIFQKEFGENAQVWDNERVVIIPDHYIFTSDPRANRNVDILRCVVSLLLHSCCAPLHPHPTAACPSTMCCIFVCVCVTQHYMQPSRFTSSSPSHQHHEHENVRQQVMHVARACTLTRSSMCDSPHMPPSALAT